jgi:3-hydroxybutyryl-CoA dehydrogenase
MSDEGIGTVAVIGAGTMGAGIAQVFAEKGFETRLFDPYPESLERGINQIEDFWRKGIERGKTTIEDKENWSRNLSYEGELEKTTSDADLIIEAAPENLDLKKGIFSELDKIAKPEAILASNTSSLSIGVLADGLSQPGRVIGMHFFNPVPLMTLLEIVRHDKNDQHIIDTIRKIGSMIGKTTILVNDVPGFATSRLGVVLGNEAIRMLAEGVASASDIDTAMRLGYKHPMGPLELSDMVGLDVRRDILNGLSESLGDERYLPHPLLEKLVNEGSLGKKTGVGIYHWKDGQKTDREDLWGR